jgi:hypothetical protein
MLTAAYYTNYTMQLTSLVDFMINIFYFLKEKILLITIKVVNYIFNTELATKATFSAESDELNYKLELLVNLLKAENQRLSAELMELS